MANQWKYSMQQSLPKFLLAWILCLLINQYAYAQKVLKIRTESLDTNLQGFLSTSKDIQIEDLPIGSFINSEDAVVNFGLGNDQNWIKFEVENAQNKTMKLVLFLDQTFLEKVGFYQFSDDSLVYKLAYGQHTDVENRPLKHANFTFPFEIQPQKKYSIFLMMKVDTVQGVSRALVRLADENTFIKNGQRLSLTLGVLIGFLLLSFIGSLLLFYFGRKKIYGIYGVYILIVAAYYLANNGFVNALNPSGFWGSARFSQVVLWLGSALHLYFIDQFLLLRSLFSFGFKYLIVSLIIASVLLSVSYAFLPIPGVFPFLSRFLLLIVSLLVVFLAIWGVQKENSQARLYSVAVLPSIMLIIYFLLTTLNALPLYTESFACAFPFTVFEVVVYGIGLVYQFNKEKLQIEHKLTEEQSMLANKVIAAQEGERQRIAQDLHDDLGSTLSMLKVRLEEVNKNTKNQLENEIYIADKAVNDLRQVSYNLMPTMFLERGLINTIKEFLRINDITSKVAFFYGENEKRLEWEAELGIYRIIKELLTNAIKHAKATKIDLQLIYYEKFLYLSVEDNGIGFKEKEGPSKGNGLKSINLRVSYLHGKLNIDSSSNGTSVLIEIPYEPYLKDKNPSG
jgi:signal transduction histidine kinase